MQLRSVPVIRFYHDDAAETGEEVNLPAFSLVYSVIWLPWVDLLLTKP